MGQATKLVNNMIVAANFAAVCEAWGLAVKVGLDPATLHEAIKGGWAGSRVMEETFAAAQANFVRRLWTSRPGRRIRLTWRARQMCRAGLALAHELFHWQRRRAWDEAQPILIGVGAVAQDHRRGQKELTWGRGAGGREIGRKAEALRRGGGRRREVERNGSQITQMQIFKGRTLGLNRQSA
jgi:hypothetical protein